MDIYDVSLLFVLKCRLLFPAATFAVDVEVEPARYWIQTFDVRLLKPLLLLLFLLLLEVPILFLVEASTFLTFLLLRWCRYLVIGHLFLLWFDYRFSLRMWYRLLLYTVPAFLDVIIKCLWLLALKGHILQQLQYLFVLLLFTQFDYDAQLSHESFLVPLINFEDLIDEVTRSDEVIERNTRLLLDASKGALIET